MFFVQLIGYAVIVPVKFNMIVDIYSGFFPLGILISYNRRRFYTSGYKYPYR
jgi:hypothetical protein